MTAARKSNAWASAACSTSSCTTARSRMFVSTVIFIRLPPIPRQIDVYLFAGAHPQMFEHFLAQGDLSFSGKAL